MESGCNIRKFGSKWEASKVKQGERMGRDVKAAYYFKEKRNQIPVILFVHGGV